MALVWGVGASWWFGLVTGLILAITNALLQPCLPVARVLTAVAKTCAVLWISMMLFLTCFYLLANLVPADKRGADFESDRRLMAVALTHSTEYVLGGIAALVLVLRMRYISRRMSE